MIEFDGFCPICAQASRFSSQNEWYRDFLICGRCHSVPRERALMSAISQFFPNHKAMAIHESSPANRGVSSKLQRECPGYTCSHYYPDIPAGRINPASGFRCENLESLTFPDQTFDLFITQDVMEHILDPEQAFKEIARVLKPGGAHIFTVPLVNKARPSECWASRSQTGEIVYHQPPEYHGNPIDSKGSLVTMHWGYDILQYIYEHAGTPTSLLMIDDLGLGIRAEYIDVLVSRKSA